MSYGPRRVHRVTDLASQAGLSPATVDRVLHGRPGVSARATRQVEQAVADLDRQQTQLRLGAQSLVLDLVMQAPRRFTAAVCEALEFELPALRPAAVRARFHMREHITVADLAAVLDGIARGGRARCDGVLLKAPDDPEIAAAVDRFAARGIPVVTLVTDVRACSRIAYVGLDNAAAGRTAAYLVHSWVGSAPGTVLTTVSRSTMWGEHVRLRAFEATLARLDPTRELVVLADTDGLDEGVRGLARDLFARRRDVAGIYSIGGGNRGLVAELDAAGIRPRAHLAHDLDGDNLPLLLEGRLTAVLHHDLRADMRAAGRQLLRHHRLLPGAPTSVPAAVEVITPYNVPPRLRSS